MRVLFFTSTNMLDHITVNGKSPGTLDCLSLSLQTNVSLIRRCSSWLISSSLGSQRWKLPGNACIRPTFRTLVILVFPWSRVSLSCHQSWRGKWGKHPKTVRSCSMMATRRDFSLSFPIFFFLSLWIRLEKEEEEEEEKNKKRRENQFRDTDRRRINCTRVLVTIALRTNSARPFQSTPWL